jgi:hypothetical protein
MQLTRTGGWRLMQLPHLDGNKICHRLCHDGAWIGDYLTAELPAQLGGHGLLLDEFNAADSDGCVVVDPRTGAACRHVAEPVDGQAHLPMCGQCRRLLAAMRGFPRPSDTRPPAVALVGAGDQRELAHHVRHSLTKIIGWSEVLHEDCTLDAAHARRIGVIYQAAGDLQRLLDAGAAAV